MAELAQLDKAARQMQDTLEDIESKIEDLKARKSTLAAKVRRAREAPGEEGLGGGGGAFGDLQRLSGRIDQLEAEVEAHDVIDDADTRYVEARFRELEKRSGRTTPPTYFSVPISEASSSGPMRMKLQPIALSSASKLRHIASSCGCDSAPRNRPLSVSRHSIPSSRMKPRR